MSRQHMHRDQCGCGCGCGCDEDSEELEERVAALEKRVQELKGD